MFPLFKIVSSFFLVSSLFFFSPLYALSIDKIIIFGDSLSDNGNLYRFTLDTQKLINFFPIIPKSPPYYQGRFSNGPVWIEMLAKKLNLSPEAKAQFENFAYGGSWVESFNESLQKFPMDLTSEVNHYLGNASHSHDLYRDRHLYVIWGGGNDYLDGRRDLEFATTNTVNIINNNIHTLIQDGAKYFLILNLPDLGLTPSANAKGSDFVSQLSELSRLHNTKLATLLLQERNNHPGIKLMTVDIAGIFKELMLNPERYQILNTKQPCYNNGYNLAKKDFTTSKEFKALQEGNINTQHNPSLEAVFMTSLQSALGYEPCPNPNQYLFWDQVHPTKIMHAFIAQAAFAVLEKNGLLD
jgi:phospholipase/lecithinase/hemolysin